MAVKPILFSCAMVRAILEGQKFQTRRVVKPQTFYGDFYGPDFYTETIIDKQGHEQAGDEVFGIWHEEGDWGIKCKYRPGDILWVRETWGNWSYDDPNSNAVYFSYFADYPNGAKTFEWPEPDEFGEKIICDLPKRRPSIHMPREAARIFLRVTEVRAERVQDITAEDVQKEGLDAERPTKEAIEKYSEGSDEMISILNWCKTYSQFIFKNLWDSINAKRGYGWDANPFVWVISFERITKDEAMQ